MRLMANEARVLTDQRAAGSSTSHTSEPLSHRASFGRSMRRR